MMNAFTAMASRQIFVGCGDLVALFNLKWRRELLIVFEITIENFAVSSTLTIRVHNLHTRWKF